MQRRDLLKAVATAPALGLSIRSVFAQAPAARPIVFAQSTAITALDPAFGAFATYPAGYEAALCLYDRLVDFDARMNIVPQLAESWQLAPDLTAVTFRLRRGVKFHDGTEFNAEAVKVNVERMMDRQRTPTNRPLWDPLAGVETPDAQTVIVRTRAPFADILNTFAHGSGAMVSPAAIQRVGDREIARNPVGAGPYRLESFNPGQQLVVVAFDDYWAGKPRTPRITFNFVPEAATRIAALRTGAADVVDAVPVQLIAGLRREQGIEVSAVPGLRPMGFAINTTRAPFNDARVRRALNLSIPVQQIAERVFFGFARAPDAPLAFNTNGYRKAGDLTFNVQQASALLAEAGWRERVNNVLTKDGQPLRLTILTSEGLFPGDVAVSEIAQNAWRQIGIDTRIERIERGSYFDVIRRPRADANWDVAMFGFNPSNASGLYHLESLFKANASDDTRPDVWNIGRYRNANVDRLLAQANTTVDMARRNDLLAEAQKLIWDDAPYVWLQVNENASAWRRGVVGVEVWPIVFTVVRGVTATA